MMQWMHLEATAEQSVEGQAFPIDEVQRILSERQHRAELQAEAESRLSEQLIGPNGQGAEGDDGVVPQLLDGSQSFQNADALGMHEPLDQRIIAELAVTGDADFEDPRCLH
jgi:hypothetical protein